MKTANLIVTWESYDADPICRIGFSSETTDDERRRLLLSLADALIKRYGYE